MFVEVHAIGDAALTKIQRVIGMTSLYGAIRSMRGSGSELNRVLTKDMQA